MVSEKEVRDRLADALAEGLLEEFEEWFVQQTWNVHQFHDSELQRLVYAIELRLAEFSSGHLDDAGLRRELSGILSSATLNIGADQRRVMIQAGSSSSFSRLPVLLIQPSGTSLVTVFA
jgi:hypothetical protein